MQRDPKPSRAKRVRERRASKATRPRRRKNSSAARQAMPPVMVRGGSPPPKKKTRARKKRPKRRYDIALPTPGVEMRLPALPSVQVGWRLLSLVLVLIFSAALYYLFTSPFYRVQAVQVEGGTYLSSESISRMLFVHNQPIFFVAPEQIATQLVETLDGLTAAQVAVNFPAQVTITVAERTPVLIWELDGQSYWIDAQGYSFPPRGEADALVRVFATDVPPAPIVLEAEAATDEPQPFMTPAMVTAVLALREYAPDSTHLEYSAEHGFGWDDPHGWVAYFGTDHSQIKMKVAVYDTLLRYLENKGIQPALVSVEYIHAPFYRLEP